MGEVATKFTPGPWDIDGKEVIGRRGRKIIIDYGSYEGLAWGDAEHSMPKEETAANQTLIASAPDLYGMVDAFINTPSGQSDRMAELQRQAIDILAQARGKEQA